MLVVYCDQCGYIKGCFEKNKSNCQICGNQLKYMDNIETDLYKEIARMSPSEKNKFIENVSGKPIDSSYKDKLLDYEIENHNKNQQLLKSIVTCPYCKSTNTKKISGTSRFTSTGIFGLASGKIGKQWHCNSCKSDF